MIRLRDISPEYRKALRAQVRAAPREPGQRRGMNSTERAYAEHLERRRLAGELLWWEREPIRIRLGDDAWYKPDFIVVTAAGLVEVHETKGFMREAAGVRLQAAANAVPWMGFIVVKKQRGGWQYEAL